MSTMSELNENEIKWLQNRPEVKNEIIDLIKRIDGYHGNELKHRTDRHVDEEVFVIFSTIKKIWQKNLVMR
jgi:hypothetical protein